MIMQHHGDDGIAGRIPGIEKYPDLLQAADFAYRNTKGCSQCNRNKVIRQFNAKLQRRKRDDAIRARIIPHKGAI